MILIGKKYDAVNPHCYAIYKHFQVVTAFPVLGVTVPRSRCYRSPFSASGDKWRIDAAKIKQQIVKVVTNGVLTRFISGDKNAGTVTVGG